MRVTTKTTVHAALHVRWQAALSATARHLQLRSSSRQSNIKPWRGFQIKAGSHRLGVHHKLCTCRRYAESSSKHARDTLDADKQPVTVIFRCMFYRFWRPFLTQFQNLCPSCSYNQTNASTTASTPYQFKPLAQSVSARIFPYKTKRP